MLVSKKLSQFVFEINDWPRLTMGADIGGYKIPL